MVFWARVVVMRVIKAPCTMHCCTPTKIGETSVCFIYDPRAHHCAIYHSLHWCIHSARLAKHERIHPSSRTAPGSTRGTTVYRTNRITHNHEVYILSGRYNLDDADFVEHADYVDDGYICPERSTL